MSNKNNSPEQKAAWLERRGKPAISRFKRFIPSGLYNPRPKPPSKQDIYKMTRKVAK